MQESDSYKILLNLQSEFQLFKGDLSSVKKDMVTMKKDMTTMKKDMVEVKETLLEHSTSILHIESIMGFYGDMYKANRESNENLNQRVSALETIRV